MKLNKNIIIIMFLINIAQLSYAYSTDNSADGEKRYLSRIIGEENITPQYHQALRHLRNHLRINHPNPQQLEAIINLRIMGIEIPTEPQVRACNYLDGKNIAPSYFRVLSTCFLFDENNEDPSLREITQYTVPMEHLYNIDCNYNDLILLRRCKLIHLNYNLPPTKRQIQALTHFCSLPIFNKNISFKKKVSGFAFDINDKGYFIHMCNALIHIEDVLKLPMSPKLLRDYANIVVLKGEEPTLENLELQSWCHVHDVDFCLGTSSEMLKVLNFLKSEKPNISDTSEKVIQFGVCSQIHQVGLWRDEFYFEHEQLREWKKQFKLEAEWFESASFIHFIAKIPLTREIIQNGDIIRESLNFDRCFLRNKEPSLYMEAIDLANNYRKQNGILDNTPYFGVALAALFMNGDELLGNMEKIIKCYKLGIDIASLIMSAQKILQDYDYLLELSLEPTLNRMRAIMMISSTSNLKKATIPEIETWAFFKEKDKIPSSKKLEAGIHCFKEGLVLSDEVINACKELQKAGLEAPTKYQIKALAYPSDNVKDFPKYHYLKAIASLGKVGIMIPIDLEIITLLHIYKLKETTEIPLHLLKKVSSIPAVLESLGYDYLDPKYISLMYNYMELHLGKMPSREEFSQFVIRPTVYKPFPSNNQKFLI